jgi:sulfatase maturation enzyme AslB (radical SAM superfamily)
MIIKDKDSINIEEVYKDILKALEQYNEVEIKIEPYVVERSLEQNNYYWLCNNSIASFLNNAGIPAKKVNYAGQSFNINFSSQLIHEINKEVFGINTTTKLSRKEFGEYMEKVFALWIEKTKGEWYPPDLIRSYVNTINNE